MNNRRVVLVLFLTFLVGALAILLLQGDSLASTEEAQSGPADDTAVAVIDTGIRLYTSQTGGLGIVGPVNLSIFGPKQTPAFGDAYSCPKAHVAGYSGTLYDPRSDPDAPENPNHIDLPTGYPFRIHIPADITGTVRVEILDPDTYNALPATIYMTQTLPVTSTVTFDLADTGSRTNAYVIDRWNSAPVGDETDLNRFWFARLDENRVYHGTPASYNDAYNTTTEYQLYYRTEMGTVRIATYTGQPDNSHDTDLKWVCPGGSATQDPQTGITGHNGFPPSFEVNLDSLSDITVNDDGSRSLFLDVETTDGWSENGFDLWAGPATSENLNAPADVNARNLYIYRQVAMGGPAPHDPAGIVAYGRGVLPLNTNINTVYTLTLAYIPSWAYGADIAVAHWDNDTSGQPILYRFSDHPGEIAGIQSGDNSWTPPPVGYDLLTVPDSFTGGYLLAHYNPVGAQDTATWRLQFNLATISPQSEVDVLPAYQISTTFDVSWSGEDALSSPLYYDVQYKDGSGGTWTGWLTGTVDTEASFSGEDGHAYYFRCRARDLEGNQEPYPEGDGDTHTTIDATPPVGSLVIDGGAEATAGLTVTLIISATDSTSCLALMQFSDDGTSFSTWETYGPMRAWTLPGGDGVKTVYVRFQDNAGNVSVAYTDTIILDTTSPTGTILIAGGIEIVSDTQVMLTLSASDVYTVTEMRLRNDSETWGIWEPLDTSRAWMLPNQRGEHAVWVQFRDWAGNVSLPYSDSIIYQPPLYLPLVMHND